MFRKYIHASWPQNIYLIWLIEINNPLFSMSKTIIFHIWLKNRYAVKHFCVNNIVNILAKSFSLLFLLICCTMRHEGISNREWVLKEANFLFVIMVITIIIIVIKRKFSPAPFGFVVLLFLRDLTRLTSLRAWGHCGFEFFHPC